MTTEPTAEQMAELRAKATPNWQVCTCSIKGPCEHLPGFRVISDCYDAPARPEDTEFAVAASRYDYARAATLERRVAELERALAASELFRSAYRKGKLALYAMDGEIAKAAMSTLPCGEGGLESFTEEHLLRARMEPWRQMMVYLTGRLAEVTGKTADEVEVEAIQATSGDRANHYLQVASLTAREQEIERLRGALERIANAQLSLGLYHGGETYYALATRIQTIAREALTPEAKL